MYIDIYLKYYNSYKDKLGYFINFRNYMLFHMHSIKTYLHIRMNKKGRELEKKLNDAKIINNDLEKSLESMSFYSTTEKEKETKLFVKDSKKIDV